MRAIASRSGVGECTAVPALMASCQGLPSPVTLEHARAEAELVLFDLVGSLLERLQLTPTSISVLVVNCSLFCPTPSLAAMIAHRFKLRSDLLSFKCVLSQKNCFLLVM